MKMGTNNTVDIIHDYVANIVLNLAKRIPQGPTTSNQDMQNLARYSLVRHTRHMIPRTTKQVSRDMHKEKLVAHVTSTRK